MRDQTDSEAGAKAGPKSPTGSTNQGSKKAKYAGITYAVHIQAADAITRCEYLVWLAVKWEGDGTGFICSFHALHGA